MVYGKVHSYKLGTMYNLIKWTTERGGSVRLSIVTSWLTGPESCCCLHLRKRLVSFVSQEPRSCSLDFHLSIWVLTSSQSFHLLKGKAFGRLGMRLFEFGAPGRSRLPSHTYATEKKAIRCSVNWRQYGGVVLLTYRPPKGKWSDYVQPAGNILLFSNWVPSITSMILSITPSYPSSCIKCFWYIHYFIFIFNGFATNYWTKSDQPPWLICKLNSGLDCARCTGLGIAEVHGFEVLQELTSLNFSTAL